MSELGDAYVIIECVELTVEGHILARVGGGTISLDGHLGGV